MSDPKLDKRKQSLYFPHDTLESIREEATRLDRSLSWIVQKAWMLAGPTIASWPGQGSLPTQDED